MCKFQLADPGKKTIVAIGSALVDILARENDDFIKKTGSPKGSMTLVEKDFIDRTLEIVGDEPDIVPGGSACNTALGAGKLGGPARFVGKCGGGRMGAIFKSGLEAHGVEPALFQSDSATGRVLSVITPDAQRTMFTFLGASAEAQPEEMARANFQDAAVVHIEGYLLFNPDLIRSALKTAKASGARISLDLASFNVVEESREILGELVKEYVDILIANEDEARAYTGSSDEDEALEALCRDVSVGVLKVGARGSYIRAAGETVRVKPRGDGGARDTTGAGDLWAAGFLYGLVNGMSLEKSGALGSACGYEVCQVIGAQIPDDGWRRIRQSIK